MLLAPNQLDLTSVSSLRRRHSLDALCKWMRRDPGLLQRVSVQPPEPPPTPPCRPLQVAPLVLPVAEGCFEGYVAPSRVSKS